MKQFTITIRATHPEATRLIREAAAKIAWEIAWGDDD